MDLGKFVFSNSMKTSSTLLITGGTGSFGKAVLKRFLNTDMFDEIRIFSRDEKKQDDLRKALSSEKVKFYIGDVRDKSAIKDAMQGVDYVFHAAALKQVPSCEFFPLEAVKTNVLGTENVLDVAVDCGVKKVIVLSTDKSVYPINAMGMSKAMMEKVTVAKARNVREGGTVFCITRYGNVMGSRGSVIPLFVDQINQGKPLTITNPNMTRFMMTLNEAVELVWFAFENGEQGDLFVQKSPASRIDDLAKAVLQWKGASNEIKFIGTRHGEKLYESLLSKEEFLYAKDLGNYYKVEMDRRDLNYEKYFSEGSTEIEELEEYHSHNTHQIFVPEIIDLLNAIELND
jgi:UDP-glucose 4-epimerase